MKEIISILLFAAIQVATAQSQYYVFTDQAFYFSEEEVRISILKSGSAKTEVVSLLLCDGNQILMKTHVPLSNGIGNVSLKIPRSILSGSYAISVYNQSGNIGSFPIRINQRTDENPLKGMEEVKSINETVSIQLKDTVQTEQLNSAILISGDDELTSLSVLITNRNPKVHILNSPPSFSTNEGIPVKGFIRDENDDLLANHSFMMVVPQVNKFYSGQTNKEGYFELYADISLSTYDGVFLSFSPQIHHKLKVELVQNSCENKMADDEETISATHDLVNVVINEAFSPLIFEDDEENEKPDYSEYYDREVKPTEYTSTSMFQVFNDVIPKVHVKGNKFGMYALESTTKLKVPPLMLVNGKPTYDYDYILSMNVDDVETIGVIASFKSLRKFFQAGNGGIIEINTKDEGVEPNQSGNIVTINGIDSPVLEDKRISKEDISFSSLLLYKSVFQLLKNESTTVEFETSLESGTYYFIASGVTLNGKVFHQVVPFFVKQSVANQ